MLEFSVDEARRKDEGGFGLDTVLGGAKSVITGTASLLTGRGASKLLGSKSASPPNETKIREVTSPPPPPPISILLPRPLALPCPTPNRVG